MNARQTPQRNGMQMQTLPRHTQAWSLISTDLRYLCSHVVFLYCVSALFVCNVCYLAVVLSSYHHRAKAQLQFKKYIYIYVYIYICRGRVLRVSRGTKWTLTINRESRDFSSVSELYRPSGSHLSVKLMRNVAGKELSVAWSGQQVPTPVNVSFLGWRSYFFIQIAPQLSSWGVVESIPAPLLLGKYGSIENQTQILWICSQKSRPVDQRGGMYVYIQVFLTSVILGGWVPCPDRFTPAERAPDIRWVGQNESHFLFGWLGGEKNPTLTWIRTPTPWPSVQSLASRRDGRAEMTQWIWDVVYKSSVAELTFYEIFMKP
jgi:hypothetical protein